MHSADKHNTLNVSHVWEAVEECVYAYEFDFRDGKAKPLDQYLPDGDSKVRRTAIGELVKVDLELQWNRGTPTSLQQYCQQYSELGSVDGLPPDLVYEAYLVARNHGPNGGIEQFCEAFPHQRDAVLMIAQRTVNQSTAITRQKPQGEWHPGIRYGDFELLTLLGEGAFGKVFLARQISLSRQVALKVSANCGNEARTMASLEHDNIVQVFSEVVLPELDARLLCMQYVPGTTLGRVIRYLGGMPDGASSGDQIVEAIDVLSRVPAVLQTAALIERQTLVESDRAEAVTLLGSQLAEALAYAHQRGVLHRDIKPDNILISQYGRPLLVDFNLSLDPHQVAGTNVGMFGGSLPYMGPEHLDAVNPADPTRPDAVDERSDVYSLGVVLFELRHLQRPFSDPEPGKRPIDALESMAAERRRHAPFATHLAASPDGPLDRVIRCCLDPDPACRYQSAADLCQALNASRELHGIDQTLPEPGRLIQLAKKRPLLMLFLAVLIPNLLGSIVNISYNALRIVSHLTPDQTAVFDRLLVAYNLIVYPACIALLIYRAWPLFFSWDKQEMDQIRRRLVTLPIWIVCLCAIGWFPGGLIFPLGLHLFAGPLEPAIFGHFMIDFTISGLIAIIYSYFNAEVILLRVLYPRLLAEQQHPRRTARIELAGVSSKIRVAQMLAGMIPLIGATLIVLVGHAEVESYRLFQLLVTALIGLGMIGCSLSLNVSDMLNQTVGALTGRSIGRN